MTDVVLETGNHHVLQEQHWTKGDAFQRLNLFDDITLRKRAQTMSGVFLMRRCDRTVAMIQRFAALIAEDFDLLTDAKSKTPNFEGFIEHRHDQSLFSLLCYLNDADVLSSTMVEALRDTGNAGWQYPEGMPIQVRRDCKRKFWLRKRYQVKHALLKIWKLLRS